MHKHDVINITIIVRDPYLNVIICQITSVYLHIISYLYFIFEDINLKNGCN